MSDLERKFTCAAVDMPTIGGFVYNAGMRDQAEIEAVIPVIDDTFMAAFLAKLNEVKEVVSPTVLIQQTALVTVQLKQLALDVLPKVRQLDIFVVLAGSSLDVKPEEVGIKAVRKAVRKGDMEGLMQKLNTLNVMIANNFDALEAVGFTEAMQTELEGLRTAIDTKNQLQQTMMEQRNQLTNNNLELLNTFATDFMEKLMRVGRLFYLENNPTKAKDYTMAQLKKRVHSSNSNPDHHQRVTGAVPGNATVPIISTGITVDSRFVIKNMGAESWDLYMGDDAGAQIGLIFTLTAGLVMTKLYGDFATTAHKLFIRNQEVTLGVYDVEMFGE